MTLESHVLTALVDERTYPSLTFAASFDNLRMSGERRTTLVERW